MDHQNHSLNDLHSEHRQVQRIGKILENAQQEVSGGHWENVLPLLRHAVAETYKHTNGSISVIACSSLTVDPARSHSLQQGFAVLAVCQQHGERLIGVAEVADAAGMTRSTAHRYMRTLLELGQLEQDRATRKYRAVAS
jgi:hypothetical protein